MSLYNISEIHISKLSSFAALRISASGEPDPSLRSEPALERSEGVTGIISKCLKIFPYVITLIASLLLNSF